MNHTVKSLQNISKYFLKIDYGIFFAILKKKVKGSLTSNMTSLKENEKCVGIMCTFFLPFLAILRGSSN